MNETELKKCPFCGGEAYIKLVRSDVILVGVIPIYECKVICKRCRCNSGEWMQKSKAIEAWNRRVSE